MCLSGGANLPCIYLHKESISSWETIHPKVKRTKACKFGPKTVPSMEEVLSVLVQWCNSCKIHSESSEEGVEMKGFLQKETSKKTNTNKTPL